MGKRTQEELERQELLREMSDYVFKSHGIQQKAQAERLGINPTTFNSRLNETRYKVKPAELTAFRREFHTELQGFGEPDELDKEMQELRQELENARATIASLAKSNAHLAALLADPNKAQEALEEARRIQDMPDE